MLETFNAADTNGDEVIDRTEFYDFMLKQYQNLSARGVPAQSPNEVDESFKDKLYSCLNAIDSEREGISIDDFIQFTVILAQRMEALMSQSQ